VTATQVYRCFDADGSLLYVGVSLHAATRFGQHRQAHEWWSDVATIRVETFPTRREALDREAEAIREEAPHHNVWVERTPDTVLSLVSGEKLVVRESPEQLVASVLEFRRAVHRGACPSLTSLSVVPAEGGR
jgi:uncharacterized protein YlzI (FlbEa/FlbD family)